MRLEQYRGGDFSYVDNGSMIATSRVVEVTKA